MPESAPLFLSTFRPIRRLSATPTLPFLRRSIRLSIGLSALMMIHASISLAQIATLDLLFDLDENPATGCDVSTVEGIAAGIELRLRTLVDTATETVTSSSHATCVDAVVDLFGDETPLPGSPGSPGLPVAPWDVITGNGASGSTLVETHLPLSLEGALAAALADGATSATVHVALSSASGADALHTTPLGAALGIALAPPIVPGLYPRGLLLAALSAMLLAAWMIRRPNHSAATTLGAGLLIALALPVSVRAGLGDGTLRSWSLMEEVTTDPAGDAPIDVDLLNLYAQLDPSAGELWLRADAFFGPPVCLDWALVDPGTEFVCTQEPPPDQGPFAYAIAMTFDDGPNPATTPSILATLRAENIPATFFMRGDRLQTVAEQALALEIHQDPLFRVANHTFDHTRFTTITPAEIQTQLETTSQLLRDAIGDPCYFPQYFRFPYGETDCTSMEVVRANGHGVAGVNVDPVDWCYASGGGYCEPSRAPWVPDSFRDDMPGYAVHRLLIAGGGIMLMHDIHANTVSELPAVIAALRAAGATFVDLSDPVLFPILNANVQTPEPPACCNGTVH